MDPSSYISSLPLREQKAMEICGITRDSQLRNISATSLLSDLQEAGKLFPGEVPEISLERLRQICRNVPGRTEKEGFFSESGSVKEVGEAEDSFHFSRTHPNLVTRGGTRKQACSAPAHGAECPHLPKTGSSDLHDYAHSIPCTRAGRAWLGALATILLVADLIVGISLAFLMLTGVMSEGKPLLMGLMCLFVALPCLFFSMRATCPVCNMRLYTLRHYPHNKYAHHFPLLGYSLSTALHLFLCFWFRCPACGTPQRLFHRRRH